MGCSIFSHSHLRLVGCKTDVQRRLVLIRLQNAFDIINQKILLKKMYSVGLSVTQLLGFLIWVVPPFTSFQESIKSKFSNVSSTSCGVAHSPTWKNSSQKTTLLCLPHHQIFILCYHQRLISSTKLQYSCFNPIKMSCLAVFIFPVPFLF